MDDIRIEIDIHNNAEVLRCIVDTLPYMGWSKETNVEQCEIGETPKYFVFLLNTKIFSWLRWDKDPASSNEMDIVDVASATSLMDFIYANQDSFKDIPPYVPPKVVGIDIRKLKKKLDGFLPWGWPAASLQKQKEKDQQDLLMLISSNKLIRKIPTTIKCKI